MLVLCCRMVDKQTGLMGKATLCSLMTSSNGNIFRVTGPLCGEFTGPGYSLVWNLENQFQGLAFAGEFWREHFPLREGSNLKIFVYFKCWYGRRESYKGCTRIGSLLHCLFGDYLISFSPSNMDWTERNSWNYPNYPSLFSFFFLNFHYKEIAKCVC